MEPVVFKNGLSFSVIGKLSCAISRCYPDAYHTDNNFYSFFTTTYVGNGWFFFMDMKQCSTQYTIKKAGEKIIYLKQGVAA